MTFLDRKTSDLRKGRYSSPGSLYFVTAVAANRAPQLAPSSAIRACHDATHSLAIDENWDPIALMVMPDHTHVLFELGQSLVLSKAISKWKTLMRRNLGANSLKLQDNFFDHRLREKEETEPFALYMFLNPYRKKLIDQDSVWPGWFCWKPERFHFLKALQHDRNNIALWLWESTTKPWDLPNEYSTKP